jgi:hypothetical protein
MRLFCAEIQVILVLHVYIFELENANGLKISLKYVSTNLSTSAIASIVYMKLFKKLRSIENHSKS